MGPAGWWWAAWSAESMDGPAGARGDLRDGIAFLTRPGTLKEIEEVAHKTKAWLRQPPTQKQLAYLPPACRLDFSLTRYQASAMLSLRFNATAIRSRIAEAKISTMTVAA